MGHSDTEGKVIQCRAAICREVNKPLTIETVEVACPKAGEVRIEVLASGVCHSDLSSQAGEFPNQLFPYVAGHEGVGVVESVGPGVTSVSPGDLVLAFFAEHCKQCRNCKGNSSNFCLQMLANGYEGGQRPYMLDRTTRFSQDGKSVYHFSGTSTFTEYSVIPETSTVKINPSAPPEKICLYACCVPTGYGAAVNSAQVEPGCTVGVWGLGSVGLCAVLGAQHAKAGRIIGIDTNPAKFDIAKKFGCSDCINPKDSDIPTEQQVRDMTLGLGVDRAIVCVGAPEAMTIAMNATSVAGGVTCIVGVAPGGTTLSFDPTLVTFGRKIVGSMGGGYKARDDIPVLVERYLTGDMKQTDDLITRTFTLDQVNEAMELLKEGKSLRSVIIIKR